MNVSLERSLSEAIVEAAPNAILTFDGKGAVQTWNLAASRLFGTALATEASPTLGTLFIPETGQTMESWLSSLGKRGVLELGAAARITGEQILPAHIVLTMLPGDLATAGGVLYVTRFGREAEAFDAMRRGDEEQQRADLLNGLIDGEITDHDAVVRRARTLGLDLTSKYALFAVTIDEFLGKPFSELQKDQKCIKELLKQVTFICSSETDKIVWSRYDGFVVLCPVPELCVNPKEVALTRAKSGQERIVSQLQGVKLTVGVSSSYMSVLDIKRCYREAKEAATVGKRVWGGNKVYHYADLGICQLLAQFRDADQLREFVQTALGKLIDHDKSKGTQLVDTLEELLSSANMKEAAERSFVHHKTMMFRKARIEEVLGISLDDVEARLTLATAIKILRMQD